jgi:hypothetical protein
MRILDVWFVRRSGKTKQINKLQPVRDSSKEKLKISANGSDAGQNLHSR